MEPLNVTKWDQITPELPRLSFHELGQPGIFGLK